MGSSLFLFSPGRVRDHGPLRTPVGMRHEETKPNQILKFSMQTPDDKTALNPSQTKHHKTVNRARMGYVLCQDSAPPNFCELSSHRPFERRHVRKTCFVKLRSALSGRFQKVAAAGHRCRCGQTGADTTDNFYCCCRNGGKHKTNKQTKTRFKKHISILENNCEPRETKGSHKCWTNFVHEPLGFDVAWSDSVQKRNAKGTAAARGCKLFHFFFRDCTWALVRPF